MKVFSLSRTGEFDTPQLLCTIIVSFVLLFGLAWQAHAAGDIDPNGTYIEGENYNQIVSNPGTSPVLNLVDPGSTSGANNNAYVQTSSGTTGSDPVGQRADYDVNFTTAGTYYFWLRLHDVSGGNSTFVGIDGVKVGGLTQTANGAWYWTNNVQSGTGGNSTFISAGNHTINIWGREDTLTDGIYIRTTAGTPPGLGGSAGQYTGTIPTGATTLDPTSGGGGDSTPPTVTAFSLPASSDSPISVTSFTAADDTGVTGYMITQTATQPSAGAAGWTGSPPSTVSTGSTGNVTFYAWAKDAAGNVSSSLNDTVDVTGGGGGGLPDIDPAGTYIEAENYTAMGNPAPWEWEEQNGVSGYSGTGYLYTISGGTGANTNGSRTDYPVNFTTGGTYCIWIRAMDASGSGGGDSTFWGVDNSYVGAITESADNQWAWDSDTQNGSNCTTISAGNHVLNLWPRESGQKTDAFVIAMVDANADPSGGGLFTGDNDRTTVIPGGITQIDPSSAGGPSSGYIQIPDGQIINGNPISPESLYDTDLEPTARQYRALGHESDGFNNFSVDPKWSVSHIGGDVPANNPSVSSGKLSMEGSGQDIWNTRDYFTYLYQGGKSGDFTIDVEVESIENTNQWAKAGIMVRQSLANNSRHAMVVITPGNGAAFQRRVTDGASSLNNDTANSIVAPRWLRLKRQGNTFTGYYSSDGISWTTIGSDNVSMSGTVNVGLAVTAHNSSADCTAIFDNFLFMPAGVNGMSETWNSTSTAAPGSISTTGWTDQDYALSVRSTGGGVDPETNTFTFNSCTDSTPSTIDIPAGQSVSGSSVSLPALFTHTGDAGSFTYQIDGAAVSSPWNSLSAYGPGTSGTVSLRVQGIDPDCGGKTVSFTRDITVDNVCSDPDPSTITILTGQSVGGGHVDITSLYSTTGDVAGLSYKINGTAVSSPWDSSAFGDPAESVTLEVSGTDPDCGNSVVGINAIEVDNTCTQNPPSISFDRDVHYVGEGRAIPFAVTIRNEDSLNCPPSTFTLDIIDDDNLSDFDPSVFNPAQSDAGITFSGGNTSGDISLDGRESAVFELAVAAQAGALEWNSNTTTLQISSSYGGHGTPTGSTTTYVFLVSPITHNSVTTDSAKWGGNWGTSEPGSKYGNFDCLTCHEKDGPNVKWMAGTIDTPDGSDWGTSGSNSLPITFQDVRDGSPDWGDDSGGHATSVRPCEVCHSDTMYHRYDTSGQTELNHFNNRDCIDCHRHSLGFTASCTGCHGDPPLEATIGGPNGLADIPDVTGSTTPGTHYKHTVVLNYPCEYCHAGYRAPGKMPQEIGGKQDINHLFDTFYDLGITDPLRSNGNYTGQDGVSYEGVVVPPGQGTMTCENIYCHGGTESMGGTNPKWNGNIACNSCHGTSATNTPPGYSHTTHVGQMGQACTICHGATPEPGSNGHVNGRVKWDLSTAPNSGSAATYKGSVTGNSNADGSDLPPSSTYGTCSNVACHFGTETPVWNSGPATCTTCHNNGSDSGNLADSGPNVAHDKHLNPASAMVNAFINQCESCHGGNSNTGTHPGHIDYSTDFSGGFVWSDPNCTNFCHGPSNLNDWNSTADLNCEACHASPYLGPTVVDTAGAGTGMDAAGYGSHIKTSKSQTINGSTNWTDQCKACHPYHVGGVTIPEPPNSWDNPGTAATETDDMASKLGLQFPVTGGIHLGGTATSGSSEAEMCWNCHGTDSELNEWGYNVDTTPTGTYPVVGLDPDTTNPTGHSYWDDSGAARAAGGSFNYGYMYINSTWTTATSAWVDSSGQGYYRRDGYQHSTETTVNYVNSRRISSVHSGNFSLAAADGSSVVMNVDVSGNVVRDASNDNETPGEIRCSYCHDVHDQNRAVLADGVTNESATGRPYLRGTWAGNPYPPSRPPLDSYEQNDDYITNRYESGQGRGMPRLYSNSAGSKMKGGYFIDANSNYPTKNAAYDTLDETAGVCTSCHGTDVDNMDYYTGDSIWRTGTVNGHSNSTVGGTGTNKRNIFSASRSDEYMSNQGNVGRGQKNDGNNSPRHFDSGEPRIRVYNTGWYGGTGGSDTQGSDYSNWYNTNTTTNTTGIGQDPNLAVNNKAHNFTCSACHSPHASGLPVLLITNCLDQYVSNYQNSARTAANPSAAGATNCHRKEDSGSTSTGWHRLNRAQ